MPREIVPIPLNAEGPVEARSVLLSWIAYPEDSIRREFFRWALTRYEILLRIQRDKPWAMSPQLLRPILFASPDSRVRSYLKMGKRKAESHIFTGSWLLAPYAEYKGSRGLPLTFVWNGDGIELDRKEASVENMIINLMDVLGYSEASSISTFKTKVWKLAKPTAHAGLALALAAGLSKRDLLDPFPTARHVVEIIQLAETFRQTIISAKTPFEFSDETTIRFDLDERGTLASDQETKELPFQRAP